MDVQDVVPVIIDNDSEHRYQRSRETVEIETWINTSFLNLDGILIDDAKAPLVQFGWAEN